MGLRVDVTGARRRLAELAHGLRAAAGGAVVAKAAEEIAAQVRAVAQAKLARHRLSGEAAADTRVDVDGALVRLHGMPPANGERWSGRSYVSLQSWWPFRSGMPPFVVKRASLILARAFLAAIGSRNAPRRALAQGIVDEADAAERASAARKAAARVRREDRAYERRVKAHEDREGR